MSTAAGEIVMKALRDVQKNMNTTIIMVTHDMGLALQADRVISLVDGQIASDIEPSSTAQLAAVEK